jgi:hypothetical protein
MVNMADRVKLARIHGGQWGVFIDGEWGPFQTKEIDNLISQIALTAHVAEGRNRQEHLERLRDVANSARQSQLSGNTGQFTRSASSSQE